jgi:acyl-CoA thioesterase-1
MKPLLRFLFFPLGLMFAMNVSAALPKKKVVILGDSITAGFGIAPQDAFPALLEKRFKDERKIEAEIVAAGISGSTSASGPSRMQWILKSKPDLVVLELGGNDGLRGQNIDATKENLRKSIKLAKDQSVKVVIVGMKLPGNYGKDYNQKFEKMFSDLAKEEKIDYLPFFFDKLGDMKKLVQSDGLHPNEEGHKLIAEQIYPQLVKLL